jgi:hypothetical protein
LNLYPRFFSIILSRRYRFALAAVTVCSGCAAVVTINHIQFTTIELYNVPLFLSGNPQLIIPFIGAAAIAVIPKYLSSIFSIKSSESASSTAVADNNNMSGLLLRMFRRNKRDESTNKNSKRGNPEKYKEGESSSQSSPVPMGLQQTSKLSVMMSSRDNLEKNLGERKQDPVSGSALTASGGNAGAATAEQASDERSYGAGTSSSADDAKMSEIIDSKIGTINEEISKTKADFGSLKEEMGGLKAEIQNITSAFESSLVELKAFQAEMVNPMNFMRQYFDTLEIKQLSDPVKALRPPDTATSTVTPAATSDTNPVPIQKPAPTLSRVVEKDDLIASIKSLPEREARSIEREHEATTFASTSNDESGSRKRDISSLLMGGMSPSKMMSIVEIVDEILAAMGPEGVNMLVEQYKHLGLKKEDELVIYNVMKMLNESKMMTDDVIAMFYRFGQVLGINDKEAELHYMRLIANKKQRRPISKPEVRRE